MTSIHSTAKLFLALALVSICFHSALAHTYLSSVVVNNVALAETDCVRPHPATAYDSPIPLVTSPDMTCGWLPYAANPANRKCGIAAGATIGLQWHHQSAASTDDIVDPTHVGPIIVYLAKSDTGAGNVWFKIYEDGYSNGQWATDKLIANKGLVNIKLPSDIAPGNYLLRGELIALHGANALDGVQPYVGCVELTISGSGTANPAGVAFPGFYSDTDPGMFFNVYQAFTSYPIPGPALYTGSSSSGSSSGSSSSTPTAAPTTKPNTSAASTNAPTSTPTSKPPTASPSSPTGNVKLSLNSGTNVWWVGVVVSGGGETTVKVELTDSGSITSWVALTDKSYYYELSAGVQVKAPISIRVTSSTGKQVLVTNAFSSLSSTDVVDTGKTYSSASSTPTSAPTTKPPTSAPTTKPPTASPTTKPPTSAPTTPARPTSTPTNNAKVTVYTSSSAWWFALTVSGNAAAVSKVEIKDSGSVSSFTAMQSNSWGYSYAAQGAQLVAPITVRVTNAVGTVVTATVSSITPGSSFETSGQL